ncbi:MAG: hypothetical protein JXA46_08475 [Dehalococcoidales bacterium]|nr:hypothetical protein [Dehalococcoidales bacterium]
MVWIQFAGCLLIIAIAGSRLSRDADAIAEKTGLGRVWIGVVLLATVTSLPEIATGISSVTFIKNPDLAIGDLFGASLINLTIIAVIDVLYTRGPLLHLMGNSIVLATILSMFLLAAAAASIFMAKSIFTLNIFGLVGIYSIILLCLYLVAQYVLFRFDTRQNAVPGMVSGPLPGVSSISLRRAIISFLISALVIVGAGIWLGFIGDQIADATGLKAGFVGTLFLAVSTTAPEMAVSISAARLGALEMAVANVIGSNLFNIGVVIFVNDLVYAEGPIFKYVSTGHILTALFALMMSSIVIIGVIFRPRTWMKSWVGIDSSLIAIMYVAAMVTLYFFGTHG